MEIAPLHYWTPTIASLPLNKRTGKKIWLKLDCNQPTGAYKIRGIGRLCQHYVADGKKHLVSSSGGNAGIAVAYAGKKLSVPVTVYIPSTSKQIYIDFLKLYGAEVVVSGKVWDEAHEAALKFTDKIDGAYVPPFDHPLIWAGHATMIDEIVAQGIRPDAIVVAVGGGGLACGVLQGMHQYGWNNIPLFTVETEGAASFAKSVAENRLITLHKIDTIATSLGAKRVTEKLFDWRKHHSIIPLIVSDKDTVIACQAFANDHRILIEPSSGAALSVIYNQCEEFKGYYSILVIVCGGVGISLPLMQEYLTQFKIPLS